MIFQVVGSKGPVYYWERCFRGSYVGLNEYGEETNHTATSSDILTWLYEEDNGRTLVHVKNPVFKTKPCKYPRLFVDGADWKYVYTKPGFGYRITEGEVGITDCQHDIDYRSYYDAKEVVGDERQKYIDALTLLGIIKLDCLT